VDAYGFQFVCAGCLAGRDVLAAPDLPEECPGCGLRDPWTGPVARSRFTRRTHRSEVVESPFYLGASALRERGFDPDLGRGIM
jgi:hypothetical protein